MILLESLYVQNYKKIREYSLKSFKDLNIFIGPNNCGKTSILESINCLNKIDGSDSVSVYCEDDFCSKIQTAYNNSNYSKKGLKINGVTCKMQENDQYLRKKLITIKYLFSSAVICNEFFEAYNINDDQFFSNIKNVINNDNSNKNIHNAVEHLLKRNEDNPIATYNPRHTLFLKQFFNGTPAQIPDISLFSVSAIFEFIRKRVCHIEDNRLQNYKNKNPLDYLRDKDLSGDKMDALIKFLKRTVDSEIENYKTSSFNLVKNDGFITSISEQGSGIRSLICLIADILSAEADSIILIDEPELGLNPSAKQEFLKFLIDMSKQNQIFITTHDPTFVNPIIWEAESTAVYLYSIIEKSFKKVNLNENNSDPATFAGYLPHTTSLKSLHLYVEGASDVYIFQTFIRKYLIENFDDWAERLNNIGIYHLGGNNWKHMLSTIPKNPYKCIILLDGDKIEIVKEIKNIVQSFELCETLDKLQSAFYNLNNADKPYPLYCLNSKTIELYLDTDLKSRIANYKKKIHGPKIAEEMEVIPDEFVKIFEILFNYIPQNSL